MKCFLINQSKSGIEKLEHIVKSKHRKTIAVDETKIKIEDEQPFLCEAIDTETREVIAVHVSYGRSGLDAYLFLKKALKACNKKSTWFKAEGRDIWKEKCSGGVCCYG